MDVRCCRGSGRQRCSYPWFVGHRLRTLITKCVPKNVGQALFSIWISPSSSQLGLVTSLSRAFPRSTTNRHRPLTASPFGHRTLIWPPQHASSDAECQGMARAGAPARYKYFLPPSTFEEKATLFGKTSPPPTFCLNSANVASSHLA